MAEFKLSASLLGHEDDVRGVLYPTSKVIVSASRDKTTRLWNRDSEEHSTYETRIVSFSGHWLNAVTYLPPNKEYPKGLLFAGGKDLIIEVRNPTSTPEENAEALLLGHSNAICSLDLDPAGKFVVSGAWDNQARIWSVGRWECESILDEHEGSVWAVLAYDSETIVTGCADQKIRVYHSSGKCLKSFQASKSPVRALCRLSYLHPSGGKFASADNEGVIRFWSLSGEQMGEAHGHESFVYSLASLPTGEIVSSGEDRTLRVWKGTQCIQTITHPAVSVWSVAVCADNGDIVSGASDNIVRVFTRSEERIASNEVIKSFEDSVKSSSIPMHDIQKEKLPGLDFLKLKSGTKDGQVQMIRENNGSVTAHTWSEATLSWNFVGTVVDSVGTNGQKEVYNDKEYDFVFDVDMEDGKPPLKLPYNLSENPFEVAADFIKRHEAPVTYLDQVANFIIQNTKPATIGQAPESISTQGQWGSEDRYRPGETESMTSAAESIVCQKILPQKDYLNITVARIPAIKNKIEQLNNAFVIANQKDVSLSATDLSVLACTCENLKMSSSSKISDSEIELILKISTRWPYQDRLPGLDLLRLLAIVPAVVKYKYSKGANFVDILLLGSAEEIPPAENHAMMAIRAIANLFSSVEGRSLARKEFKKTHDLMTSSISSTTNRNLLVAVTTVYINYSVYLINEKDSNSVDLSIKITDLLINILKKQIDSEVIYRALVALGTLVSINENIRCALNDKYGIEVLTKNSMSKASDPRIRKVCQEILDLLKGKI
ncbi:Ubiquitin homeostasis protein lub1 [Golovinomyces cichoracearum]|uniref:Ubiquitin homeostasis protein lub1 n=1 Tax=Golovinomyces cichoracearum TaxID=62708 RepID=A0A420J9Z7_9PEZI|nr:Ubiquitin homeostasis protein lub1 [Golovinomyces cichoracearum]